MWCWRYFDVPVVDSVGRLLDVAVAVAVAAAQPVVVVVGQPIAADNVEEFAESGGSAPWCRCYGAAVVVVFVCG